MRAGAQAHAEPAEQPMLPPVSPDAAPARAAPPPAEEQPAHGVRLNSLDSSASVLQQALCAGARGDARGSLPGAGRWPPGPLQRLSAAAAAALGDARPPGAPAAAPSAAALAAPPVKGEAEQSPADPSPGAPALAVQPALPDTLASQRMASLTHSTSTAATAAHFAGSSGGPGRGGGAGFAGAGNAFGAGAAALAAAALAPGTDYAAAVQQLAAAGGMAGLFQQPLFQQHQLLAQMPWLALGLQARRPRAQFHLRQPLVPLGAQQHLHSLISHGHKSHLGAHARQQSAPASVYLFC